MAVLVAVAGFAFAFFVAVVVVFIVRPFVSGFVSARRKRGRPKFLPELKLPTFRGTLPASTEAAKLNRGGSIIITVTETVSRRSISKLAACPTSPASSRKSIPATALVHEAYLRLVGNQEPRIRDQEPDGKKSSAPNPAPDSRLPAPGSFHSRGHFFAAAAEAMRRILVERARQKAGPLRGGNRPRVSLEACNVAEGRPAEVLAVHEALDALAAESPIKRAAAVQAAYAILLARLPAQADDLNAKRVASLAAIKDGQSEQRGIEWGQFVAEAMLVIPTRHVAEYSDHGRSELNAVHLLFDQVKRQLQSNDPTVKGFNIGINFEGRRAGRCAIATST